MGGRTLEPSGSLAVRAVKAPSREPSRPGSLCPSRDGLCVRSVMAPLGRRTPSRVEGRVPSRPSAPERRAPSSARCNRASSRVAGRVPSRPSECATPRDSGRASRVRGLAPSPPSRVQGLPASRSSVRCNRASSRVAGRVPSKPDAWPVPNDSGRPSRVQGLPEAAPGLLAPPNPQVVTPVGIASHDWAPSPRNPGSLCSARAGRSPVHCWE